MSPKPPPAPNATPSAVPDNVPIAPAGAGRLPPDEPTPAPPAAVMLPSRRDWKLVADGLVKKADASHALSKKAADEGYSREAVAFQVDADRITKDILPAVNAQRELALGPKDALEHVTQLLHAELHRAVIASPRPKLPDIEDAVAAKVTDFAERLYRAGWGAGYAARQDDVNGQIARAADAARLAANKDAAKEE